MKRHEQVIYFRTLVESLPLYHVPILVATLVGSIVVSIFMYTSEGKPCKKFIKNNPLVDISEAMLLTPLIAATVLLIRAVVGGREGRAQDIGMSVILVALGCVHIAYIRNFRKSNHPCAESSPMMHEFIKIESLVSVLACSLFLVHYVVQSVQGTKIGRAHV